MLELYENYKHRSLVGEEVEWAGYWLTSERFYHIPIRREFVYNRDFIFNSEIQNIHLFFRKKFVIDDKEIKQAKMFITGDDIYKLYVNAEFVGEGPAQSYPFAYNYNCFDVTDLLQNGENTIAVQLHYQGLANIYTLSADDLCGMIAQLEIEFCDGTKQIIVSDRSWKHIECDYTTGDIVGALITFAENIDFNKYPKNWRKNDFDDSAWSNVYIQAKPFPMEYNLVPQITPTVKHEIVYPTEIRKIENGYFFDFGKEIVGNIFAIFNGTKGDVVTVRCGEELFENGRVRYKLRIDTDYQEFITLSGEEDFLEFFEYKGFRYAEILNTNENFDPKTVCAICRNYPFEETKVKFNSSNELMNKVWEISANTLKISVQDTYYDCPTRERGGFVGDALTASLVHFYMTGDIRIYKKFIMDIANNSRYNPVVSAHVPSYNINFCAEYSSLVPMLVENYYTFTGDKELVEQMLPVAEGVWDYFEQFLNEDYLLESIQHMLKVPDYLGPILIDWPQNHRYDYDFDPVKKEGICTVANMFFYGFLKNLAKLYRIVKNEDRAEQLEKIYTKMGCSIIEKTYDDASGLFKDTPVSNHYSVHANTLQLCFNLVPPKGFKPLIDFLKEKRFSCSLGFGRWVLFGLFNIGENAFAYDLLTCKDENSWYTMISEGATTIFEAWGKDQKWNTSLCHPWGAYPTYFYVTEIMGIKPDKAGFTSFKVQPYIPDDLDWAELQMPIPTGIINAYFKRTEKGIDYKISVPEGVEITFEGENINFTKL